ncbi:2-amino-4-hydroxy-6-hydroxymethyldihydropteridine diphosphokinase [Parabacteroides sp. PF5-9]|uniref:2-amino-4-hydroxy-6- hydroxymethyldihydropteridine diphosphokinase n=1 Tax=Parabacteroides sp. PF5-9 TaxID=1742404 RepID=UPI002475C0E0|nr:2-amino-4-hydroxy-6-hydroxymethyldihydropteridine diphosphokinase [Parabacteroides sp. PF5-9]MDH6359071.1 2-amino-4-hydroxy-6-hydroxymethyldihydropteridine diphosphokinase [Parabacteroides sp. PF5-9]
MFESSSYHKIVLSLGSNEHAVENIEKARQLLSDRFEKIRFSQAIYTDPIDMPENSPQFINQVAIAYTMKNPESIKPIIKQIEQHIGRNANDKEKGVIPIDIDLLQWNDLILKPEDMQRDYVTEGLHSLSME